MCKLLRSVISLLLAAVLLLTMAACGTEIPGIMEDGADRFAQGKDEEEYILDSSEELLKSLIDKYSGAYRIPDSSKMDDSAYDAAKGKIHGTGGTPTTPTDPSDGTTPDGSAATDPSDATDPTGETQPEDTIPEVGSWEDFMRVFHNAYIATADVVEFRLVNGFTVDPSQDLEKCFRELQREDPIFVGSVQSWSWGYRGNDYLVEITYTMDTAALIALKAATEAEVKEAVAKIDVTGMSDYEIVCAVNDYLCDVSYYPPNEPYAPETHTAYGALENGVSVCEGYACAAKLLLNAFGIPCDIQIGVCTNGGGHAWNLVKLDGQWYQLDVTWNDGSTDRDDYLLVTDEYMKRSRTWDYGNYPASATQPYTP